MLINNSRLTSNKAIQTYLADNNYVSAAKVLLKMQKEVWRALSQNYKSLQYVKTKTIRFSGFSIKVQFNPGRMKSTSADVDEKTILGRSCFLCDKNLPAEQEGLLIYKEYFLYCNPHPIFPEHFTIVSSDHKPQEILSTFSDFIKIARILGNKYSLIYNGPKCGASAPDHLHFQSGTKHYMPIESEFYSLINQYGNSIFRDTEITVSTVDDGLRKFISFESRDENVLYKTFLGFYEKYKNLLNLNEEPLMNIICGYEEESGWKVVIFLRTKHRSSHFYGGKGNRILFSPAAIDLGGICITPIEKDFVKLNDKLLVEIFNEVFTVKEEFDQLKSILRQTLNS